MLRTWLKYAALLIALVVVSMSAVDAAGWKFSISGGYPSAVGHITAPNGVHKDVPNCCSICCGTSSAPYRCYITPCVGSGYWLNF